jgi:16S rRNA (guanine966-N2)-methyltransferase
MRVIAGIYKSRKLQTLRGLAVRPSSDRLRETLFNILAPEMHDAVFVDLFAGSGSVGIEALSRGARLSIFVEHHAAGAALLRRNLQSLSIAESHGSATHSPGFAGTAEVLALRAMPALDLLEARGVRADFVFADPPYADDAAYESAIESLGESEVLAPGGRAIFEHQRRRTLPAVTGRLERARVIEQGDSALSFYRVVLAA